MLKLLYGVSLGPFALNSYKDTVTVFIIYGVHHILLVYIFPSIFPNPLMAFDSLSTFQRAWTLVIGQLSYVYVNGSCYCSRDPNLK